MKGDERVQTVEERADSLLFIIRIGIRMNELSKRS